MKTNRQELREFILNNFAYLGEVSLPYINRAAERTYDKMDSNPQKDYASFIYKKLQHDKLRDNRMSTLLNKADAIDVEKDDLFYPAKDLLKIKKELILDKGTYSPVRDKWNLSLNK